MTPHERNPYSAIVDRPPLKPPDGGNVIIWTIVNLEVWDLSRPMPRTAMPAPSGQTVSMAANTATVTGVNTTFTKTFVVGDFIWINGQAPAQVIAIAHARDRKIGICGQAPSDYPDFAQFLVEQNIDSISLTPDTVLNTTLAIAAKEREMMS